MEKKIRLREAVKKIVSEKGPSVFSDAAITRNLLTEQGISAEKALTVELILTACPAVAGALQEGKITRTEANVLVGTIMRQTSLSATIVREMLGELLLGVGVSDSDFRVAANLKTDSVLGDQLSKNLKRKGYQWSLTNARENYEVAKGRECLKYNATVDTGLSELDRLATEGNAVANYAVGEYLGRGTQSEETISKAHHFYELSAKLGYGPAYGALADQEIRSMNGSLEKAAEYLRHPIALEGLDGQKWRETVYWMSFYRRANVHRIYQVIIMSVLALVLGFFVRNISWQLGTIAVLAAGISLARAVYARVKNTYQSQRLSMILITASWVSIVFGVL